MIHKKLNFVSDMPFNWINDLPSNRFMERSHTASYNNRSAKTTPIKKSSNFKVMNNSGKKTPSKGLFNETNAKYLTLEPYKISTKHIFDAKNTEEEIYYLLAKKVNYLLQYYSFTLMDKNRQLNKTEKLSMFKAYWSCW